MKIDYQKLQDEKTEIEAFLAQPEAYADARILRQSRENSRRLIIFWGLVAEIEQLKKNLEEAKVFGGRRGAWGDGARGCEGFNTED